MTMVVSASQSPPDAALGGHIDARATAGTPAGFPTGPGDATRRPDGKSTGGAPGKALIFAEGTKGFLKHIQQIFRFS